MRISADTAMRVPTAAPGLQPAWISEAANVPDVPNVAAESTASARPARAGLGRAVRALNTLTSVPPLRRNTRAHATLAIGQVRSQGGFYS